MKLLLSKFYFRSLFFIVYFFTITGCDRNDTPFPRCISADYFGPKPITVSAHFPSGHDAFFPEDDNDEPIDLETGEINYGFHYNQVIKWKDTGLETNGNDLIIRIKGAWKPWDNNNKKESKKKYDYYFKDKNFLSNDKIVYKEQYTDSYPDFKLFCNNYKSIVKNFSNDSSTSCTVNCKFIDYHESIDENSILNFIPCWFSNGYGAYILFKRQGDENPNKNLKSMRNPQSPTIHLGHNSIPEGENSIFILKKGNRNKLKDKNCNMLELKKGWRIYLKILDGYYLDNLGGYSFEFLSGVQKPNNFGFFDNVYQYLKCILLINKNCQNYFNNNQISAAQVIFQNIAENSKSFHNLVFSLLILFIIISSLLYLFGFIQDTKHDIFIRMIKIVLVILLISPKSFKFFYNYFFTLFVDGLEYTINIITNFASSNTNITDNNSLDLLDNTEINTKLFSFMEDMFDKFFSYSVWKKFSAFLHYQVLESILMVPIILMGIFLYFFLCLYAYIIFLSGFIGIAFLIAIMPLFLISILFSTLKSLFDGWIKFSISFCLQSVMIFSLLSLLSSIIMNTFYRQLGFTVCYNKWLEIRLCTSKWLGGKYCLIDKQYFGWTPGQIFIPYTIGEASKLNNKDIYNIEGIEKLSREGGKIKFTDGVGYIFLPPNYVRKGFRYIDYPFFNILGMNENLADHYIAENDIVVNKDCKDKDLVRLVNTLLHTLKKENILFLINIINEKIGNNDIIKIVKYYCSNINNCNNYNEIISEIKFFVKNMIKKSKSCKLEDFNNNIMNNNQYQKSTDYQRIIDIQRGYLINLGEIFILFLFSFLIFSLREFVQQIGSSIAGGGYSIYSISNIYSMHSPNANTNPELNASSISKVLYTGKSLIQDTIGKRIDYLGNWINHLPNRLVGGASNFVSRIPHIGNVLKHVFEYPRKSINLTIESIKFMSSPKNDVDKLEEKIYKAFGIDSNDITHRRIARYLDYYKMYIGSSMGYTLEDTIKYILNHEINYMDKNNTHNYNFLYRIKYHRKEFLSKLYDYTIGHEIIPDKYNDNNIKSNISNLNKSEDFNPINLNISDEFFENSEEYLSKRNFSAKTESNEDKNK